MSIFSIIAIGGMARVPTFDKSTVVRIMPPGATGLMVQFFVAKWRQ